MFLVDLLFALAVSLLLTAIFAAGFRNRGPWDAWWVFLLVVFLGTWAGGLWLAPFGPTLFDVAWLPFLFIGLLFTFLLAAAVPAARPPRTRGEVIAEARAEEAAITTFSVFFWVLLVGLVVAIVLAYVV